MAAIRYLCSRWAYTQRQIARSGMAVSYVAKIILLPVWRDSTAVLEQVDTRQRLFADVRMASIHCRDLTG